MKQKVILIVAILVGLLAFWLTHSYLVKEREKLYASAEKIKVIVAVQELPAGTVLKVEDLGVHSEYKTAVGQQVIRPEEIDVILGKKLRFAVRRADPLRWSDIDMPERLRSGLAPAIKSGMRAISLGISGEAAVSGLVQPNDRVDILGTFTMPSRTAAGQMEVVTMTVLQDVTILATGTRLAKSELGAAGLVDRGQTSYSSVTLEVTSREAELLVFTESMKGKLTLALRNPEDVGFEKTLPEVNFQYMEKQLPDMNTFRQQNILHKREP
jgi:pilus assembly protein CpaB